MANWNIIADSSCDLKKLEGQDDDIEFSTVPFTMQVGNEEFIDDEHLNTEEMIAALARHHGPSVSACPSPGQWAEQFRRIGKTIALTISSNLSGSFNSACAARNMVLEDEPDKEIAILDSKSTGPEIVLMIQKITELIRENTPFETIVKEAKAVADRAHIVFALCSFDNLVKNGRVGRLAGFVAGKLGLWGVGIGSDDGKIVIKHKVRGPQRMIRSILEDMKERAFKHGQVVISHCRNEEMSLLLKQKILETWEWAQVRIIPARGLDSFYAEDGGLIVAYY